LRRCKVLPRTKDVVTSKKIPRKIIYIFYGSVEVVEIVETD
jgi:hypothetical protein